MFRQNVLKQNAVALLVVLMGYFGAGLLQGPIQERRAQLRLTANPDVYENLPPRIAFTQVLLGGFRGLAVDFLWARSTKLQVQGKYHEALQLAEWITQLQPHFSGVWQFQAHNLSYEVASSTHDPKVRWHWVQSGIRMIRDDALVLNPTDKSLHRYLMWLIYDKIGSDRDLQHFYFKDQFALEWDGLLGAPPEARDRQTLVEWLAPHAETLRDDYRMDPDLMVDLMVQCGSCEWRHPATHGLYWLLQGALRSTLDESDVRLGVDGQRSDLQNEALDVFYRDARTGLCLQDLILRGHVRLAPQVIPEVEATRDRLRARYAPDPSFLDLLDRIDKGHRTQSFTDLIAPSRTERLLLQLISWYHFDGQDDRAEAFRQRLQRDYSRGARRTEQYQLPVVELLVEELVREHEGVEHLEVLINQQYYNFLHYGVATGRNDVAQRYRVFAERMHAEAPKRVLPAEAADFPTPEQLFAQTVGDYLLTPSHNAAVVDKALVWRNLPAELRRQMEEPMRYKTYAQAEREGFDPELLFPF